MRKTKIIAIVAIIVVIINLITLLIVQNLYEEELTQWNGSNIWSLVSFISVILLVIFLLSLCFDGKN